MDAGTARRAVSAGIRSRRRGREGVARSLHNHRLPALPWGGSHASPVRSPARRRLSFRGTSHTGLRLGAELARPERSRMGRRPVALPVRHCPRPRIHRGPARRRAGRAPAAVLRHPPSRRLQRRRPRLQPQRGRSRPLSRRLPARIRERLSRRLRPRARRFPPTEESSAGCLPAAGAGATASLLMPAATRKASTRDTATTTTATATTR